MRPVGQAVAIMRVRLRIISITSRFNLHTISPIDHLNYSSRQEAEMVLAHTAGVNNMCSNYVSVQYQDVVNPPIGHPVLSASAALSWKENLCVSGKMDLATDYLEVAKGACFITFCFTEGTKIIQDNIHTKSIKNIKTGDTILSFNQKTMKIEKDIVRQIDSIKHKDIVNISFSDLTENDNTFDHLMSNTSLPVIIKRVNLSRFIF